MTLNRVHDDVEIREGGDSLILHVEADPDRVVAGLNERSRRMKTLTNDSTEDDFTEAARFFASVIFGAEQAEKLLEFYHKDANCVMRACSEYFTRRLSHMITDIQKKRRKADKR
jgi:ABC-type hemin transport system substrate-binding protein